MVCQGVVKLIFFFGFWEKKGLGAVANRKVLTSAIAPKKTYPADKKLELYIFLNLKAYESRATFQEPWKKDGRDKLSELFNKLLA